jgi:hypothetical protein
LALLSPAAVTYVGTYDSYNPEATIMNLGGNRTSHIDFLIDGADNESFVVAVGALGGTMSSATYGGIIGSSAGRILQGAIKLLW